MEIYHFSHPQHPLILKEVNDTACVICYRDINGPSYACESCMLYIHESCSQLSAKIGHPFHGQHVLSLQQTRGFTICDACELGIEGFSYRCSKCDFYLHTECTSLKPNIKHEGHEHLLTLIEKTSYKSKCSACRFEIQGAFFVRCVECDKNFHFECEGRCRLPATVVDQRHLHPLDLIPKIEEHTESVHDSLYCDTCHDKINATHPAYYCAECDFRSHVRCIITEAKLSKRVTRKKIKIKKKLKLLWLERTASVGNKTRVGSEGTSLQKGGGTVSPRMLHERKREKLDHLNYLGNKSNDDYKFSSAFSKSILVEASGCEVSGFYYGESCTELPGEIHHPFHRHPPTLDQTNTEETLTSKGEILAEASDEVTNVQDEDIERLKHFSRPHFRFLQENEDNDSLFCGFCHKGIQGPSYCCDIYNCYFHQSCAKLRKTIVHPFHRHRLTLRKPYVDEHRPCIACYKVCKGFFFSCDICNFYLDVDCEKLQPSIAAEDRHEHNLTLFEKLHETPECIGCKFTPTTASYLRCVRCNFNVHVWCSRLPTAIKHESHHHELSLQEKFVDEEYVYEICDVCEQKRNREECVYCCEDCYFVAEFNCVIAEVITYLKEKSTRNVGWKIIDRGETYRPIEKRVQDLLDRLTEEDQTKINGRWEDIGQEIKNIKRTLTIGASDGEVDHPEMPPYLAKLIRNLGSQELKKGLSKKFWQSYDEVVTVGNYTISRNLAPVLEKLIAKYGDFGANCSFSECLMTYLSLRLCEVVQSMRETKVVDITDELMFDWWHQLKFVGHGGLQIDFAFDHLNRIAQARDVIDTEDYENSPLHGLQKEMAKCTDEIEDLMAKVKKLEQQKLKVISEHSESSGRDPKRLSEGLDLILRNAGAGLLGHFDVTVDGETDSVRFFKSKLELR